MWTGLEPLLGEDVHIIRDVLQSFAGSLSDCLLFCHFHWLPLIIASRPNDNEGVARLDDINDIRNGFLLR